MVDSRPIRFTAHAELAIAERQIDHAWVERTVREPEWRVGDPADPEVTRFYRAVPERGDRILRVVCVETDLEIRILSAYLDRGARRPT